MSNICRRSNVLLSKIFCLEIALTKGANYWHLTASTCVGLCLYLCASENQPTAVTIGGSLSNFTQRSWLLVLTKRIVAPGKVIGESFYYPCPSHPTLAFFACSLFFLPYPPVGYVYTRQACFTIQIARTTVLFFFLSLKTFMWDAPISGRHKVPISKGVSRTESHLKLTVQIISLDTNHWAL